MKTSTGLYTALLLLLGIGAACAESKNGFNLDNALIPAKEIFTGGPPRDGIPAIDHPRFVSADRASFLKERDLVLGMVYKGAAKAYPINILNWHEVVNDRFEGEAVAVTFCPLCGSGMAFSAEIGGISRSFGVSGLLYNSDVLLYDRQTESLWSQLMTQAVSGPMKGQRLKPLPLSHTTWVDWKTRHPDTLVLSIETGYGRNYAHSPYADYIKSPEIMFPVSRTSRRYHPKEQVMGIEIDGRFKAYPFVELAKTAGEFTDTVGGEKLLIRFNREHRAGAVFDSQGGELPSVITFWFSWYAFHPQTDVFPVEP